MCLGKSTVKPKMKVLVHWLGHWSPLTFTSICSNTESHSLTHYQTGILGITESIETCKVVFKPP